MRCASRWNPPPHSPTGRNHHAALDPRAGGAPRLRQTFVRAIPSQQSDAGTSLSSRMSRPSQPDRRAATLSGSPCRSSSRGCRARRRRRVAAYALAGGDAIVRERTLRLPLRGPAQGHLEIIRFAAANRLCVDLDYDRKTRRIEPYSLRRTQDGNFILHAWSVEAGAHRSYRVDRIEGARTSGQSFTPRYEVELTPTGPVPVRDTDRSGRSDSPRALASRELPNVPRRAPLRRGAAHPTYGPTYVYQCGQLRQEVSEEDRNFLARQAQDPVGISLFGTDRIPRRHKILTGDKRQVP